MTNSKSTKRALLTSALAMLMCVTMLIGTTFAWFTDTASTAVNKIQAGTLDVELWQADVDEKLSSTALKWVKADGHAEEAVLWEPGCTYNLESFRIKNNGNLALKYKVIISGIVGDAKLLEAIDFTVKIGDADPVALANWDGTLAKEAVTDKITITGTMKTTAGNEYQNLSIDGISITVYATQATVEYDSKDNQYDKDAAYSVTAQQWTASFTNGATVTVDTPTAIDGKADTATGEVNPDSEPVLNNAGNVELNLQNTVTSGNLSGGTWGVMRVMPGTTLTITGDENGKFINTKSNSIINVNGGKVVVNSGYFESTSNIFFYYTDSDDAISNMSLTINGGTYKADGNVIRNPGMPETGITINGGTFYEWDPSSYVDGNHTVTTSTEGETTIYTVTAK